jgi:lipopolysaccharide transport system permease protein
MSTTGLIATVKATGYPRLGDGSHLTIIEPRRGWRSIDVPELWRYRELLGFLVWRDVKVRYKQTVLGAAWAILQPLMTMIVFSIFFARMAGVSSGSLPYPIFAFAGLLPWTFFANAVASAGNSVVGSERLITKVYFPRLMVPLSSVGASLVDFAVALGMLGVMMIYYGIPPVWTIVLAPPLIFMLAIAAAGVGSILAALSVSYRDFRYVVPFLVQLWMFATPTVYMQANQSSPGGWRSLLPLNPAYGLIGNFRAAVLGQPLDLASLAISSGVAVALFVGGLFYFRRVERGFADII